MANLSTSTNSVTTGYAHMSDQELQGQLLLAAIDGDVSPDASFAQIWAVIDLACTIPLPCDTIEADDGEEG